MKIGLREREHDGYDDYLTTIQETYWRLVKSSGDVEFQSRVKGNLLKRRSGNVHVSFLQSRPEGEQLVKGTDGKTWPETKCFKCLKWGHIASFCPQAATNIGQQSLQIGFSLQQGMILETTQLLDTCSTDSCTNNLDLITNVLLNTNGGQRLFDQKGVGVVIPVPMYYNKESICTIYAVKDILNIPGARITYDSELGKVMNVYVNDKIFKFEEPVYMD